MLIFEKIILSLFRKNDMIKHGYFDVFVRLYFFSKLSFSVDFWCFLVIFMMILIIFDIFGMYLTFRIIKPHCDQGIKTGTSLGTDTSLISRNLVLRIP